MKAAFQYPPGIERLTAFELENMLEHGEISVSLFYRRSTLVALTELAALAKGTHSPMSRWRLKTFRAELERMEGNDEIEITGEMLCETVMHAMTYLGAR